ncbi:hypothetical protein BB561_004893 [Smittium simulii]|uniref:Uncharacterized protein n=1 Tax=Smittium simulii TaxID=133385 RepID=A0A2T9YDP0_9FUNG|nr:hypothetical protein BB561_004893 [Smittium simulii]
MTIFSKKIAMSAVKINNNHIFELSKNNDSTNYSNDYRKRANGFSSGAIDTKNLRIVSDIHSIQPVDNGGIRDLKMVSYGSIIKAILPVNQVEGNTEYKQITCKIKDLKNQMSTFDYTPIVHTNTTIQSLGYSSDIFSQKSIKEYIFFNKDSMVCNDCKDLNQINLLPYNLEHFSMCFGDWCKSVQPRSSHKQHLFIRSSKNKNNLANLLELRGAYSKFSPNIVSSSSNNLNRSTYVATRSNTSLSATKKNSTKTSQKPAASNPKFHAPSMGGIKGLEELFGGGGGGKANAPLMSGIKGLGALFGGGRNPGKKHPAFGAADKDAGHHKKNDVDKKNSEEGGFDSDSDLNASGAPPVDNNFSRGDESAAGFNKSNTFSKNGNLGGGDADGFDENGGFDKGGGFDGGGGFNGGGFDM